MLPVVIFVSLLLSLGSATEEFTQELICQDTNDFFLQLKNALGENDIDFNIPNIIRDTCTSNPQFKDLCDNLILPNIDQFLALGKLNAAFIDEIMKTVDEYCNLMSGFSSIVAKTSESLISEDLDFDFPQLKPCETCVFFMTFLQNELEDNLSEENIGHYLNGTCDQFEFGQEHCKKIVSDNFDVLIEFFQEKISAVEICTFELDFCDPEFFDDDIGSLTLKCELCEFIIGFIYRKIGNENNMNKITSVLQKVCNILPIGKQLCRDMISHFLPKLKDFLLRKFSPTMICGKINFCKKIYYERIQDLASVVIVKEYIEKHPFEVQPFGSSSECQFCQWTISAVQSWLSDGHTQTEIALFLNQLCNFFGNYAPQCEQLVKVYVPKLIDSIIEKQTPPLVCSNIGFCKL